MALVELRKLAALGVFQGGISHETLGMDLHSKQVYFMDWSNMVDARAVRRRTWVTSKKFYETPKSDAISVDLFEMDRLALALSFVAFAHEARSEALCYLRFTKEQQQLGRYDVSTVGGDGEDVYADRRKCTEFNNMVPQAFYSDSKNVTMSCSDRRLLNVRDTVEELLQEIGNRI